MSPARLETVECTSHRSQMPPEQQRRGPPPNLLDDCTPIPRGRRIRTFLHATVLNDRYVQAKIMIDALGERVNVKDIYGRTPLMLACLIENQRHGRAFIALLLSRGAQVNETDQLGRTALHYACLRGDRAKTVIQLLSWAAIRCVQSRDAFGYTALMYAAMRRSRDKIQSSADVVQSLIQIGYEGSSVDELDDLGYTPLLLASRCGNWVTVRAILEDGRAETRIRDNEFRMTALDWARRAWLTVAQEVDGKKSTSFRDITRRTSRRPDREHDSVCKMYDSLKPFRCRHPKNPPPASFCVENVTQGLPEIFQTAPTTNGPSRVTKNGRGGQCDEVEPDSREALVACIHLLEVRQFLNEQRLNCAAVCAAPSVQTRGPLLPPISSAQGGLSTVPARLPSITPLNDHPVLTTENGRPPTPDLKVIAASSVTSKKRTVSNLNRLFSLYLPDQFNTPSSRDSRLLEQHSSRTDSNVDEGLDAGIGSSVNVIIR